MQAFRPIAIRVNIDHSESRAIAKLLHSVEVIEHESTLENHRPSNLLYV